MIPSPFVVYVGRYVVTFGGRRSDIILQERRLLSACDGDERAAAGVGRMLLRDAGGRPLDEQLAAVPPLVDPRALIAARRRKGATRG